MTGISTLPFPLTVVVCRSCRQVEHGIHLTDFRNAERRVVNHQILTGSNPTTGEEGHNAEALYLVSEIEAIAWGLAQYELTGRLD